MTQPKEIYLQIGEDMNLKEVPFKELEVSWCTDKIYNTDLKYLSEEHFNSLIEKWKDEEKIWKQELEEKDKEIDKLKEEIKWLLNKITK